MMRQFSRIVPRWLQLPQRFCWSADDDAGHWSTHLRPPCLHSFRKSFDGVTAEPGHQSGSHVSGLLHFPQRGYVQPSAAQLRVTGRARIDSQAIVTPQVQDTLPADELAWRSGRGVVPGTPEPPAPYGTAQPFLVLPPAAEIPSETSERRLTYTSTLR